MFKSKKMTAYKPSGSKIMILPMIILMLFMAILPLVASAPPFTTSTTQQSGCQIAPIIRETLKTNQNFDFNFHVFNLSNGVPLSNTTLSCYFHFYNQTGDHVFSTLLKNDPISEHQVINEWAERLNGSYISTIGYYAYIIQCNGTATGCADKGAFTVTNSGYEATSGRAMFDIGLLFVLALFLFGAILMFIQFDNLLARVGMFGLSYLLLIAITFISWQMASDFLLSAQFLVDMFRILFFVLVIGTFPLLIGAFAWYVIMLFRIKEIERLMDKGMSRDEAEHRQGRKFK